MKEDLKAWCQQHHCEALAQLAVHDVSREALLRNGTVVPALEVVAQNGMNEAARELAAAALLALSNKKLEMVTEGQKHVMLSYQWAWQATIKRLNESLIARGYATWFDLTHMKGVLVRPLQLHCSALLEDACLSVCTRVCSRSGASTCGCVYVSKPLSRCTFGESV